MYKKETKKHSLNHIEAIKACLDGHIVQCTSNKAIYRFVSYIGFQIFMDKSWSSRTTNVSIFNPDYFFKIYEEPKAWTWGKIQKCKAIKTGAYMQFPLNDVVYVRGFITAKEKDRLKFVDIYTGENDALLPENMQAYTVEFYRRDKTEILASTVEE